MASTRFKKIFFLFWIALTSYYCSYGQSSNIGTPPITSFNKKDYKGSPQNWDVAQGKQGLMYFANNDGLLEFDGTYWRCYKVRNQTIVRSVAIAEDGKIFVGAQGEIGYFFENETGILTYQSLNYLLPPEEQFFADVWDIVISGNRIYFSTGNTVFLYQNGSLNNIYTATKSLSHLAKTEDEIIVHDIEKGLLKYTNEIFSPLLTPSIFSKQKEVSGILAYGGDTLLVSTIKSGLFLVANNQVSPWQVNDNNVFKNSSIYCATKVDEKNFAFGTSTKGVIIVNKQGQVIRHIDRKVGLQVNNVLALFRDQMKNLWVGLDNGIDLIETNSPFTNIYPGNDLKSLGYAIQIYNNQIYFGTANGVYTNDWKAYYNPTVTSPYSLVTNSEGQVWDLSVHGNDLLLNHHEGTFVIKNNTAVRIPSKNGSWIQLPVLENKYLSGYYDGLLLLEKDAAWRIIEDFENDWRESCRIIVKDEQGNIWVSHPYHGLFKLRFNADFSKLESYQLYNSKQGFPSDLNIYVFKIGEEAVFCGERGVYSYNEETDRFDPNEKWNTIFGKETRVRRLIEASNGDIWFVTNNEIGVLEVKDGGIYKNINKRVLPQLKDRLVNNFEEIYPYDEENVFIAHEAGFIHYDPKHTNTDTSFNALIRQVLTTKNDSILYGGNSLAMLQSPVVKYKHNSLRIAFSATYFGSIDNNQFQYALEGYDKKWSSWGTKTQVDYTNLNAGTYTFKVRAKNINGNVSNVATYNFKILPPWYASRLAFITYALLAGSSIFFLIFIPRKRFDREKTALQSEQKKTLLQKEREHQLIEQERQQQISQLEKEKLELQIQSKNQELASSTMHLVQKSEVLRKIKEELQKIVVSSKDEVTNKYIKRVIRKVSIDERIDEDWEQFAKHFDQVHSQFLQRLRSQYTQLTPKDHRLCAYLRMNLSSKEMASLMNISVRSVEVARYRLRKKLDLDGEVNLVEFMLEV